MTYKLELLPNSMINLVFHMSILKNKVGTPNFIVVELPTFDDEGQMILKLKKAMQYQSNTKGEGRKKCSQVLVEQKGVPRDEVTQEDYVDMIERFPNFNIKDKDIIKEKGNDTSHTRK